jgi:hypothetical protein
MKANVATLVRFQFFHFLHVSPFLYLIASSSASQISPVVNNRIGSSDLIFILSSLSF